MRIITYGTFDLFHYGHYRLLKRCKYLKKQKNTLIVGVSSDEMCKHKNKVPVLNQRQRINVVKSLKMVDKVILENNMEQKVKDVIKYKIDCFVLGDDYKNVFPQMPEYKQLIDLNIKIIFLKRTKGISTTILKKSILV